MNSKDNNVIPNNVKVIIDRHLAILKEVHKHPQCLSAVTHNTKQVQFVLQLSQWGHEQGTCMTDCYDRKAQKCTIDKNVYEISTDHSSNRSIFGERHSPINFDDSPVR